MTNHERELKRAVNDQAVARWKAEQTVKILQDMLQDKEYVIRSLQDEITKLREQTGTRTISIDAVDELLKSLRIVRGNNND